MKSIISFLIAAALSSVSCATTQGARVLGVNVTFGEKCVLNVSSEKKSVSVTPGFSSMEGCRMVTHAETSIIKTMFVNGMYVLFLESNQRKEDACHSEYTAIGIGKDKSLYTTPLVKTSGSCYVAREETAFEYFSRKLTKHTEGF